MILTILIVAIFGVALFLALKECDLTIFSVISGVCLLIIGIAYLCIYCDVPKQLESYYVLEETLAQFPDPIRSGAGALVIDQAVKDNVVIRMHKYWITNPIVGWFFPAAIAELSEHNIKNPVGRVPYTIE